MNAIYTVYTDDGLFSPKSFNTYSEAKKALTEYVKNTRELRTEHGVSRKIDEEYLEEVWYNDSWVVSEWYSTGEKDNDGDYISGFEIFIIKSEYFYKKCSC